MKHFYFITFLFSFSILGFAQSKKIPKGWDLITLEGKPAYMNLITGEVSTTLPKEEAKYPVKKIEIDPSIIHKVKKGETLSIIARKYNISLNDIYRLNAQFNYNAIKIGQEIVVGYDKAKEGKFIYKTDKEAYVNPSNNNVHYVKQGETLFSLSRKYYIPVSKLKSMNNLDSNILKVGQKLIIRNL